MYKSATLAVVVVVVTVVVTVVADWFDVVVAGLLKLNGVVEPKLKDILFL